MCWLWMKVLLLELILPALPTGGVLMTLWSVESWIRSQPNLWMRLQSEQQLIKSLTDIAALSISQGPPHFHSGTQDVGSHCNCNWGLIFTNQCVCWPGWVLMGFNHCWSQGCIQGVGAESPPPICFSRDRELVSPGAVAPRVLEDESPPDTLLIWLFDLSLSSAVD